MVDQHHGAVAHVKHVVVRSGNLGDLGKRQGCFRTNSFQFRIGQQHSLLPFSGRDLLGQTLVLLHIGLSSGYGLLDLLEQVYVTAPQRHQHEVDCVEVGHITGLADTLIEGPRDLQNQISKLGQFGAGLGRNGQNGETLLLQLLDCLHHFGGSS